MKWRKRLRGGLRAVLALFLLCLAAVAVANLAVVFSTRGKIVSPQEAARWDADCILVLGAGVRADGTPSAMLQERIDMGVALYQAGVSDRILMSGDHSNEDYDEVNVMKACAMQAGVPSSAVFMDHAGFSTYESMARAAQVFGVRRVVIVTQQYHLYRALYLARAYGLEAVGVACDTQTYSGQAVREVREIAARTKDFALAVLRPAPTIGGEAIPITGDGDMTNDKAFA